MPYKRPLLYIVILIMLTNIFAVYGYDVGDYLDFYSNIEFMKGHMMAALGNLEAGNITLAVEHASHPIEENFALVKPYISEVDPDLSESLEDNLYEYVAVVSTGDLGGSLEKYDEIVNLLDEGIEKVIPSIIRDGFIFRTLLIIEILELAEHEYEEAVVDGELASIEEYQDAKAFIERAIILFQEIKDYIPEEEAKEIEEFFNDLKYKMGEYAPSDTIKSIVGGIIREFREVAYIETEDKGAIEIIENIEDLLVEVINEYKAGEYEEAEELAIKAYLENYEFIESMVKTIDPELNEEIEHLLREELRELINQRVSVAEIERHISKINELLDKVEILIQVPVEPTEETVVSTQDYRTLYPWMASITVLSVISVVEGIAIYKLKKRVNVK